MASSVPVKSCLPASEFNIVKSGEFPALPGTQGFCGSDTLLVSSKLLLGCSLAGHSVQFLLDFALPDTSGWVGTKVRSFSSCGGSPLLPAS